MLRKVKNLEMISDKFKRCAINAFFSIRLCLNCHRLCPSGKNSWKKGDLCLKYLKIKIFKGIFSFKRWDHSFGKYFWGDSFILNEVFHSISEIVAKILPGVAHGDSWLHMMNTHPTVFKAAHRSINELLGCPSEVGVIVGRIGTCARTLDLLLQNQKI